MSKLATPTLWLCALACLSASGQLDAPPHERTAPAFCYADDPADPDYDIADFEPGRDADDFCKLAHNQPHKARRQLNKAVALVRATLNPNRFYLTDYGHPDIYIQLLRPWMRDANDRGEANWQVKGRMDVQPDTNSGHHDVAYSDHWHGATFEIWDWCGDAPTCPKGTPSYEIGVWPWPGSIGPWGVDVWYNYVRRRPRATNSHESVVECSWENMVANELLKPSEVARLTELFLDHLAPGGGVAAGEFAKHCRPR